MEEKSWGPCGKATVLLWHDKAAGDKKITELRLLNHRYFLNDNSYNGPWILAGTRTDGYKGMTT